MDTSKLVYLVISIGQNMSFSLYEDQYRVFDSSKKALKYAKDCGFKTGLGGPIPEYKVGIRHLYACGDVNVSIITLRLF